MNELYSSEEKVALKIAAGIPHMPTDLTCECRNAVAGLGPRAYDWSDKPHRLVYDLCREIEAINATPSELVAAASDLLALLDDYMVVTSLTANDRYDAALEKLRAAISKAQPK